MKILHESLEKRWQFQALAQMDGVLTTVEDPKQVILLLHGLNERGRRIYRKLLPYLPDDANIISPNAPFPIAKVSEKATHYGFTWYFYDRLKKDYFINQDIARSWLKALVESNNPDQLPVTIIGFSQGGYLAPLIGRDLPQTRHVIGLACGFRDTLIEGPVPFHLTAIHGLEDPIIPAQMALTEIDSLRKRNILCQWHPIADTGHEISQAMGKTLKEILEQHGNRSL